MSWSISITGTKEEAVAKLQEHSSAIEGQSKTEYDQNLPHLIGIVEASGLDKVTINANGSGIVNSEGVEQNSIINVTIQHEKV